MPSFDIVSKVDPQTLDNALNVARKEILNRYDFRDTKTTIELDKKANSIHIVTENSMRLQSITDILIQRAVKQGIDAGSFDFGKDEYAAGSMIKKDIKVKEGLDKEVSKKIVKLIKDLGLKVQASIMDDQVRVAGKKIDDLQGAISALRGQDVGAPLQFVNMKS